MKEARVRKLAGREGGGVFFKVQSSDFKVQISRFRFQRSDFNVQSSDFKVQNPKSKFYLSLLVFKSRTSVFLFVPIRVHPCFQNRFFPHFSSHSVPFPFSVGKSHPESPPEIALGVTSEAGIATPIAVV
ncbi:MAG: hypothetical protein LBT53_08220, partial [Puniceicoccales bacterium]|nr:hypothetical protein [Puniceicoccales bacterium]